MERARRYPPRHSLVLATDDFSRLPLRLAPLSAGRHAAAPRWETTNVVRQPAARRALRGALVREDAILHDRDPRNAGSRHRRVNRDLLAAQRHSAEASAAARS